MDEVETLIVKAQHRLNETHEKYSQLKLQKQETDDTVQQAQIEAAKVTKKRVFRHI